MKSSKILLLVPIVIIGLVGTSWWYLQKTNDTNEQVNKDEISLSETTSAKTDMANYKDSAGLYEVAYPKDWKLEKVNPTTEAESATDWSTSSQPVKFFAPGAHDGNAAVVQVLTDPAAVDAVKNNWKDNKRTAKTTKIRGYNTEYAIYSVKSDTESYTNHEYLVSKNGQVVMFSFRSKYGNSATTPATKWDDTRYTPGFLSIVRSIKFLK